MAFATDAAAYVVSREMLEPILRARPEVVQMLGRVMAERRAKRAGGGSASVDHGVRAGELRRRIQGFFGLRH